MTMFIHFFCLCPLRLTIKLNFNISKVAYSSRRGIGLPYEIVWDARLHTQGCKSIILVSFTMGVHGETPLVLVAIVSLGCSEEIIIIKRSCFLLVLDFCQSLESGRLAGFPLIAAGNLVLRGKLEPRPRLVSFNRPFYRYSGHFK